MRWPWPRRPSPARSGGRDFALLWTSTTVSTLGDATTTVALPLVALITLHASTLQIGIVSAASVGAWIVFGLTAGVWVDRLPKRPLLIVCDIARAAALLSVPIAAVTDVLTLAQLVVVAFVISVGSVFAGIGFQAYVPWVVAPERLLPANSQLQGSEQAASVGGPALGGALVQLVGAPATLLTDMASYLVSAVCLRGIGRGKAEPEPEPAPPGGLLAQIREGLSFVWRHPVLRPLALTAASLNLWSTAFTTLSVVFLVRTLHVSPGLVGVLLAADGVGGVLGAVVVGRLVERLGNARTLIVAVLVGPALSLLIPLTTRGAGLLLFVVGTGGLAVFIIAFSVVARVYRQTVSPPQLLGRVTAVNKFISWGVLPIGALLAGALGSAIGNRPTMWVIAIGIVLTTPLAFAFSPLRSSRELEVRVPQPAGAAEVEAQGTPAPTAAGAPPQTAQPAEYAASAAPYSPPTDATTGATGPASVEQR
jgi:MFS family permease